MNLTERFLRYVTIHTTSSELTSETIPSTPCQWDLARVLEQDMKDLGIDQVHVSSHAYVFGKIPSNIQKKAPAIGFIAHMDTSPDASGKNVHPRIIRNYDGGEIILNEALGMSMSPASYEVLSAAIGKDLIVTDGTTLLGGDDKAGVTAILCAAEYLLQHPEIPHGEICIGFTPDEEIGNGPTEFDVADFGADLAYTVDGGLMSELQYENFNGASAFVEVRGSLIHPGEAKGKMVNAGLVAMEFNSLLPAGQTPRDTCGYEGFYHLTDMKGDVAHASLSYIIRDHSRAIFEERKNKMREAAREINRRYGEGTLELHLRDSYFNMSEMIEPHPELLENAKKAMLASGVTPEVVPIRGGTDGARLSFMGLPCPNIFAGGLNFHGKMEFVPVESMEKAVEVIRNIITLYA